MMYAVGEDEAAAIKEATEARAGLDFIAGFLGLGRRELAPEDGAWLMAVGVIAAAIDAMTF